MPPIRSSTGFIAGSVSASRPTRCTPVRCTTPPMSSSSPARRSASGSVAGGIAALGVGVSGELQPVQARRLRRGVVGADLGDQPAVRVEVVPLVAAQHHARLGLLVRPLDHRPVGVRVADDLVDGPAGAQRPDRPGPLRADGVAAAERPLVHVRREVVHRAWGEERGHRVRVARVAGVEVTADDFFHPPGLGRPVLLSCHSPEPRRSPSRPSRTCSAWRNGRAYPAGPTSAGSGRKYRLEAGVKISAIDTREMSQITMPAAKSAVAYTGEPADSAASMVMVIRPKNAATAILAGSRRRLIAQAIPSHRA